MRGSGLLLLLAAGCGRSGALAPDPLGSVHPSIESVEPASGTVGTLLVLAGSGFGEEAGSVSIGGVAADPVVWNSDEIEVVVPAAAYPGLRPVTVRRSDSLESAPFPFAVRLPEAVYANAHATPNQVYAYALGAAGSLTALAGSPIPTGGDHVAWGEAQSIDVNAGTRRLFAANGDSVAVFDVDGATGALLPVTGSPFQTVDPATIHGLRVHPSGSLLFAGSRDENELAVFSISSDGTLSTVGSPYSLGGTIGDAEGIALSEDGTRVWAGNGTGVAGFSVGSGGSLSPLPGSPWDLSGANIWALELSPSGTRIVASDWGLDRLHVADVDAATGAIAAVAGSPFLVGPAEPCGSVFAVDGLLLLGSYTDGLVRRIDLAADGTATALSNSIPLASGRPWTVSLDADRTRLFVLDGVEGEVEAFDAFSGAFLGSASVGAGASGILVTP